MKMLNLAIIAFLPIIFLSCNSEKKEGKAYDEKVNAEITKETNEEKEEIQNVKTLAISLSSKNDNKPSGNVTFTEESDVVTMVAYLNGLAEGEHSINIYKRADTSSDNENYDADDWNTTIHTYEKWKTEKGYIKGDIGNFNADSDGKGSLTFATNEWCIGCEKRDKNIIGKTIIIHQERDDSSSQSTDNSEIKVICGGVIK